MGAKKRESAKGLIPLYWSKIIAEKRT